MQLPLALALTLLPTETPLLGTAHSFMTSAFCRTHACTFISRTRRTEPGDDWVYRYRLTSPATEIELHRDPPTGRLT